MYDNSFSKDYSPMVNILSGEPNISKKIWLNYWHHIHDKYKPMKNKLKWVKSNKVTEKCPKVQVFFTQCMILLVVN